MRCDIGECETELGEEGEDGVVCPGCDRLCCPKHVKRVGDEVLCTDPEGLVDDVVGCAEDGGRGRS